MKIAIVGGGIFGCTSAIILSNAGHKVDLFERQFRLMNGASMTNQYRLHRGYHYPRSNETVSLTRDSVELFEQFYPKCILTRGYDRIYAIASGSFVTPSKYESFMVENSLEFKEISPKNIDILNPEMLQTAYSVKENAYDYFTLYTDILQRLRKSKVNVFLKSEFTKKHIPEYDVVINCTYSNLNSLLSENEKQLYQFELVEKPMVSLPEKFQKKSVVIVDGPFCCIDPFGSEKYFHVMGNVELAIHDRQVGYEYKVPAGYERIIDRGLTKESVSRFPEMLEFAKKYFKFDGCAVIPHRTVTVNPQSVQYMGSRYTVRTVLPQHEHDDARPSSIIKHSDNLYSIFGGKIGTSVSIANEIVKLI